MPSAICTCGQLKVRKVGTREINRVVVCNRCQLPLEFSTAAVAAAAEAAVTPALLLGMVTTLDCVPGYRVVMSRGVVTELSATAGFTAESMGNAALDQAMNNLRRSAVRMSANAIVCLRANPFGVAATGVSGNAVGVRCSETRWLWKPRQRRRWGSTRSAAARTMAVHARRSPGHGHDETVTPRFRLPQP